MRGASRLLGLAAILFPLICWGREGQPTQQVLHATPEGDWGISAQVMKYVCKPEQYTYEVKVPRTVTKEVVEGGATKQIAVTVYETATKTGTRTICIPITEMTVRKVDPKSIKAFETDGRAIPTADVAKRCAKGTLVVVSANDEMIPDYYAAVFKPGTIIITLPRVTATPPLPPHGNVVPAPAQPIPAAPPAPPTSASKASGVNVQSVSFEGPASAIGPNLTHATLPPQPAPELVFISRDGADSIKIRQFEESQREADVKALANDSSVSQEIQIKGRVIHRQSNTTVVPFVAVRIGTSRENLIPADRVKAQLTQETVAVLSTDGKLVDEFWLQNLKPTTLVVRGIKIAPSCEAPMAMPMPAIGPPPGIAPGPAPAPAPQPAPATGRAPVGT